MQHPSAMSAAGKRLWTSAFLACVVLTFLLAFVLVPQRRDPTAEFQAIKPGMTYQQVQAVLAQPHVAGPLARSFGTPVKESLPVLQGDPSFEKQEWGRVDGPAQYEPEWARVWRTQNRVPLSTAERRLYTVRQWGVGNTQSYCFIAIFDESGVLVCRYWSVPTESQFGVLLRRNFGL
jgi:hypothetical protein